MAHELSDDVDGLLRHDGVQLHQLVVPEPLHDLSLLQEGLGGHGSWLQSLHRYLGGAVPHAWHTDESMLTGAQKSRDAHRKRSPVCANLSVLLTATCTCSVSAAYKKETINKMEK